MKILVDMPDDWKMGGDSCPMGCNCATIKCPLSNAVKAVEVTTWDGEPKHHGKPVRLFAVETDKEIA